MGKNFVFGCVLIFSFFCFPRKIRYANKYRNRSDVVSKCWNTLQKNCQILYLFATRGLFVSTGGYLGGGGVVSHPYNPPSKV